MSALKIIAFRLVRRVCLAWMLDIVHVHHGQATKTPHLHLVDVIQFLLVNMLLMLPKDELLPNAVWLDIEYIPRKRYNELKEFH